MRAACHSFRLTIALVGLALAGCGKSHDSAAPEITASPRHDVVTLSADEQQAVGIQTTPVARRKTASTLKVTGWLAAVPQSEVLVRSPVTGFVVPPTSSAQGEPVSLGTRVAKSARMATLEV